MLRRLLPLLIAIALLTPPMMTAHADDVETGKDRRTDGVTLSFDTATQYANLFTGSSSYSIPIELPTGPGGLTPALALTYNSDAGNGWFGLDGP